MDKNHEKGIEDFRREIEAIDQDMAVLFSRRMALSRVIGAYKKEAGLPVRDLEREEVLLEKNQASVQDQDRASYRLFFEKILELSREAQTDLAQKGYKKKDIRFLKH